ncbi:hypothetical protein SDC9_126271 [bioreactor metagenome]|uniref:Uncharacterized protein n=1 Tax=bioreactor metagenome TaxID=1076179 RepID=A0A645CQQ9_9ZZZZ
MFIVENSECFVKTVENSKALGYNRNERKSKNLKTIQKG